MSQDVGYVLYSAFGSFYIPSCIMVFVYVKIYYAARDRARRNIKVRRKSRRKSNRLNPNAVNKGGGGASMAARALPTPSISAGGSTTYAHKSSIEQQGGANGNNRLQPNGGVPTISGGTLNPTPSAVSSGASPTPTPTPSPSPLPSAMKRRTNSSDAGAGGGGGNGANVGAGGGSAKKMTRFSFGDETVLAHRAAQQEAEEAR